MNFSYPEEIQKLPIAEHLEEISNTLKNSPSHFLVLTAETAAGKSTAVPFTLMKNFSGKILILEPRRLAAIAIASRISDLNGTVLGQETGYRVHLENKTSSSTKVEVITEAILTRRLQQDPSLEGVSVVVIDEFHERSIHADLALAFLKESMSLRNDLYVIVMSATIDTESLSEYLGENQKPAPVLKIPGRTYPVDIQYAPDKTVSRAVLDAIDSGEKGILVFFPGLYEITRAKTELEQLICPDDADIFILHSSINLSEQKKVLSPINNSKVRIILSSAIAETSLTVPDITCVIDTGTSRFNRMNNNVGGSHLVTEKVSQFSAAQRAGRAGRTQKGRCIRLWKETDILPESTPSEISRTDLSDLVLECAQWGAQNIQSLDWLEPPQASSWTTAQKLLQTLKCIDENNSITDLGKAVLKVGLGPRLSLTAIYGGAQSILPYSAFKESNPELKKRFIFDVEERLKNLRKIFPELKINEIEEPLLKGFPDRIAVLTEDANVYRFPSGRTASVRDYKGGVQSTYIVAPEIDAGDVKGTIFSYKPIVENYAKKWLLENSEISVKCEFDEETNRVKKTQVTSYGKIILSKKELKPEPEDTKLAICNAVRQKSVKFLPFSDKTVNFLTRTVFYHQCKNEDENLLSFEKLYAFLEEKCEEWLLPFLTTDSKVNPETVYNALYWFLDGAQIDSQVPQKLTLENGKTVKIIYENNSGIQPVLEIIIQQIFGCFSTPEILGKPVLIKLLSPARRPLQITTDLENFWNTTWPEICKEMKGRYPKHNWDYRISE